MSDWPDQFIIEPAPQGMTTFEGGDNFAAGSLAAIARTTLTSAVWPVADLAIYMGFQIHSIRTIYQLSWFNGSVASGNVDIGVYDVNLHLLTSAGGVAQSGTGVIQIADVTNVTIAPGNYFLAMSMDNITGTIERSAPTAITMESCGCAQQSSAYPLPSTATFATIANAYYPFAAVHFVATV